MKVRWLETDPYGATRFQTDQGGKYWSVNAFFLTLNRIKMGSAFFMHVSNEFDILCVDVSNFLMASTEYTGTTLTSVDSPEVFGDT